MAGYAIKSCHFITSGETVEMLDTERPSPDGNTILPAPASYSCNSRCKQHRMGSSLLSKNNKFNFVNTSENSRINFPELLAIFKLVRTFESLIVGSCPYSKRLKKCYIRNQGGIRSSSLFVHSSLGMVQLETHFSECHSID